VSNTNSKFTLQKAQSKDAGFKSPVLNMLTSLGGLGVFGGIICICVVFLSALSQGKANGQAFLVSVGITIISACIFIISYSAFRKKKKEYIKKKKSMIANAACYNGKVTGIVKQIRHVKYMKENFDEITWCFNITYTDNEGVKNVYGDLYMNDITKVLKDDHVTVLVLNDGSLAFKNFHLRKDDSEPCKEFTILEIEKSDEI